MKITVAGLGYVGSPLACLLAEFNTVYAYDIVDTKVDALNKRRAPVGDKELSEFLSTTELDLQATTNAKTAFADADILIIATPTDYKVEENAFNTSSIEAVIDEALACNKNLSIFIKSTIPVGYIEKLRERYEYERIYFSPEFLREGKALYDNQYPSRIIVGGDNADCKTFAKLLAEVAKNNPPTLFMGTEEAEAVKLFANTYLATRVAFFNELDTYCEVKKLNSSQVIEGVSLDPRIGNFYNNPSFGYGGYCLPKDTRQLNANFSDVPSSMISAVVQANDIRKQFVADQILKRNPRCVGIYRLTMKTGSDNFRSSSIFDVIEHLKAKGVDLVVFEPILKEACFEGMKVISSFKDFAQMSDVIVANRYSKELEEYTNKLYTRDVFNRD